MWNLTNCRSKLCETPALAMVNCPWQESSLSEIRNALNLVVSNVKAQSEKANLADSEKKNSVASTVGNLMMVVEDLKTSIEGNSQSVNTLRNEEARLKQETEASIAVINDEITKVQQALFDAQSEAKQAAIASGSNEDMKAAIMSMDEDQSRCQAGTFAEADCSPFFRRIGILEKRSVELDQLQKQTV